MKINHCQLLAQLPAVPMREYTASVVLKTGDPVQQVVDNVMARHFSGKAQPDEVWVFMGKVYVEDVRHVE